MGTTRAHPFPWAPQVWAPQVVAFPCGRLWCHSTGYVGTGAGGAVVPPGASRPVPQVRTVRRRQCGPRTAAWQRHCARTCQRSRGADETVRLFELVYGARGQREHERLAAAHVRVGRDDRELGRRARCRRAQHRQHRPQCPTHVVRTQCRWARAIAETLHETADAVTGQKSRGHCFNFFRTAYKSPLVVLFPRNRKRSGVALHVRPAWLRCASCGTMRCCTT